MSIDITLVAQNKVENQSIKLRTEAGDQSIKLRTWGPGGRLFPAPCSFLTSRVITTQKECIRALGVGALSEVASQ